MKLGDRLFDDCSARRRSFYLRDNVLEGGGDGRSDGKPGQCRLGGVVGAGFSDDVAAFGVGVDGDYR